MFIISKKIFYKKLCITSIEGLFTISLWSTIYFYNSDNLDLLGYLHISFLSFYSLYIYTQFLNCYEIYKNINKSFEDVNEYKLWYSNLYTNKRINPLIFGILIVNGVLLSINLYTKNFKDVSSIFLFQYILISVITFIFLSILLLYSFYLKFCVRYNIENIELNNIKYTIIKIENNDIECCICLEKWVENKNKLWCKTICSHIFHVECIDVWFENSQTCPICRT